MMEITERLDNMERDLRYLRSRASEMQPGEHESLAVGLAEYAHQILAEAEELKCRMSLSAWDHIVLGHGMGLHVTQWTIHEELPEGTTEKTLPEKYQKFIQGFKDDDNPPFEFTVIFNEGWSNNEVYIERCHRLIISCYYWY
jgi:hypothetical protein